MNDAHALWQFIRHDRVGRSLGIAGIVVAWFALTWMSVTVALVLPCLAVVARVLQRRRGDVTPEDDLADLL